MRFGGPDLVASPGGCEVHLILEPASDEIISGVHLEVIAAAAAFAQMDAPERRDLGRELPIPSIAAPAVMAANKAAIRCLR